MKTFKLPTVLAGAAPRRRRRSSSGCVADRPSRNGVFNENQYLRKDFLIQGDRPERRHAGAATRAGSSARR